MKDDVDALSPRAILRNGVEMRAEAVAACLPALEESFSQTAELCEAPLNAGGKIVLFGNGGSAADARHIASELKLRFTVNRRAIPALALTTDASALTACGNDAVIGISTSGRSPNALAALRRAREIGVATIGFTGGVGGEMPSVCDVVLCAPATVTARSQEIHILLGRLSCEALEKRLGYVN